MTMFVTVIRLKHSGWMAKFDDDGQLVAWTHDVSQASLFENKASAEIAIKGLCAPEIRAAIRSGYAERVRDGETGEEVIVVATDREFRPLPTPRIRLPDYPRYCTDDPLRDPARTSESATRARKLVKSLFAEAPSLNWKLQASHRPSLKDFVAEERLGSYTSQVRTASVLGQKIIDRERRKAAKRDGRYTGRTASLMAHVPAA